MDSDSKTDPLPPGWYRQMPDEWRPSDEDWDERHHLWFGCEWDGKYYVHESMIEEEQSGDDS